MSEPPTRSVRQEENNAKLLIVRLLLETSSFADEPETLEAIELRTLSGHQALDWCSQPEIREEILNKSKRQALPPESEDFLTHTDTWLDVNHRKDRKGKLPHCNFCEQEIGLHARELLRCPTCACDLAKSLTCGDCGSAIQGRPWNRAAIYEFLTGSGSSPGERSLLHHMCEWPGHTIPAGDLKEVYFFCRISPEGAKVDEDHVVCPACRARVLTGVTCAFCQFKLTKGSSDGLPRALSLDSTSMRRKTIDQATQGRRGISYKGLCSSLVRQANGCVQIVQPGQKLDPNSTAWITKLKLHNLDDEANSNERVMPFDQDVNRVEVDLDLHDLWCIPEWLVFWDPFVSQDSSITTNKIKSENSRLSAAINNEQPDETRIYALVEDSDWHWCQACKYKTPNTGISTCANAASHQNDAPLLKGRYWERLKIEKRSLRAKEMSKGVRSYMIKFNPRMAVSRFRVIYRESSRYYHDPNKDLEFDLFGYVAESVLRPQEFLRRERVFSLRQTMRAIVQSLEPPDPDRQDHLERNGNAPAGPDESEGLQDPNLNAHQTITGFMEEDRSPSGLDLLRKQTHNISQPHLFQLQRLSSFPPHMRIPPVTGGLEEADCDEELATAAWEYSQSGPNDHDLLRGLVAPPLLPCDPPFPRGLPGISISQTRSYYLHTSKWCHVKAEVSNDGNVVIWQQQARVSHITLSYLRVADFHVNDELLVNAIVGSLDWKKAGPMSGKKQEEHFRCVNECSHVPRQGISKRHFLHRKHFLHHVTVTN
eukprot:g19145.t1